MESSRKRNYPPSIIVRLSSFEIPSMKVIHAWRADAFLWTLDNGLNYETLTQVVLLLFLEVVMKIQSLTLEFQSQKKATSIRRSQKQSKMQKMFKFLWMNLCLGGYFVQMFQLGYLYFSYQVAVTVTNKYPEKFEPLGFALCFYISDILNWNANIKNGTLSARSFLNLSVDESNEELFTMFNHFTKEEKFRHSGIMINNLTSPEICNLTARTRGIIETCSILNINELEKNEGKLSHTANCEELFEITQYVKEPFKCFNFDLRGFHKHDDSDWFDLKKNMRVSGFNGLMYQLTFKERFVRRTRFMVLAYHKMFYLPRPGIAREVSFFDLSKSHSITYQHFLTYRLPKPYISDCFSYTQVEDSGHCYELCARNASLKNFNNRLFPGPTVRYKRKNKMISFTTMTPEDLDKMHKLEALCAASCRKLNCTTNIHVPVKISSLNQDPALLFYVQPGPSIVVEYIPRSSLISYLTQCGSCLGVWAGLSLCSLIQIQTHWITFKDKKTRKNMPKTSRNRGFRHDVPSQMNLMYRPPSIFYRDLKKIEPLVYLRNTRRRMEASQLKLRASLRAYKPGDVFYSNLLKIEPLVYFSKDDLRMEIKKSRWQSLKWRLFLHKKASVCDLIYWCMRKRRSCPGGQSKWIQTDRFRKERIRIGEC